LGKKKSGEASPEELTELEELLASRDEDEQTHEVLDRVWLTPMPPVPETSPHKNVWYRIQKSVFAGETRPGRLISLKRYAVAASILLLSLSTAWYYLNARQKGLAAKAATPTMNQIATQPGSKTRVELPDGTQVWLNSNSQITYGNRSFGTDEREVTLSGEAYFDVAKNEKIPFIIHTTDITIKVLGTAFNVRAYPKERTVETALIRGMVSITTRQDPERTILLKPAEKLIVPVEPAPEESRLAQAGAPAQAASPYSIVKMKHDTAVEAIWIKNKLEFDNQPLEELAPKMEIWYNIKIHFADETIRKRRFSVVIEKETLLQTLAAMRLSGHLEYQLKGEDLWLREN